MVFFPKLFWLSVRKNCSSDQEKLLEFEAEGWELEKKKLRSLEQLFDFFRQKGMDAFH